MSEKFNPVEEDYQDACARAVGEELKVRVDPADFGESQLVIVDAASQKFSGLSSEYHVSITSSTAHSLSNALPSPYPQS
jgi:hypothetical protein